jgi:hypothetical protein
MSGVIHRWLTGTALALAAWSASPADGLAQPATEPKTVQKGTAEYDPKINPEVIDRFLDQGVAAPVVPGQPLSLPPSGWPHVDFPHPDPLIDRPYSAQPGWYANLDVHGVFNVHLRNQLSVPVLNTVTGNLNTVRFAGNGLDATASPRFEVGYRLEDGRGSFQLGYRFLATRGSDSFVTGPEDAFQGAASQTGGLDYNIVDFDYVSREYALDPNWDMQWSFGGRFATLFFDSHVHFLNPLSDPGSILAQSEGNSLRTYGAHGVLDLSRKLPFPGWSAFGRIEATGSFGRLVQTGREQVAGNPGVGPLVDTTRIHATIGQPTAAWVLGLSYTIPSWNYSRFLLGYEYEVWWEIGRVAGNNSEAQLDTHGLFVRAEINF